MQFIDVSCACKICGEPFGINQCCGCSPVHAKIPEEDRDSYRMDFDRALSCVILDEVSGRIVTLYKDAGERRLADVMAYFIFNYCKNFAYSSYIATYIPATKNAIIRRGFDHAELLAKSVADKLKIPLLPILDVEQSEDQRKLGRAMRKKNMEDMFSIKKDVAELAECREMKNILLIDDVTTTGATLNAASKILHNAGFLNIVCVTFARAY